MWVRMIQAVGLQVGLGLITFAIVLTMQNGPNLVALAFAAAGTLAIYLSIPRKER